ncbi:unnamed protein product [Symbiodinium microadriaticum]|nr:unnamed protein product [Symbiodinium microadriaticum]
MEDLQTRSRLYRGLTRAQLLAIVVNERVQGGWLEFLGMVTFSESSDEAVAEKESVQSIQKAAAKVHEEALQTVVESHAESCDADAAAVGDDSKFLDEFLDEPMPATSTVWDTSSNTMSIPTALLFNPFFSADEVPIAMFSARWNARNEGIERLFRDVPELLRGRCIRILGVDAESPENLRYFRVLKAKRGVMLAVCTADYGEMDGPYGTNAELTFALQHNVEILPLKVEEIYPPQPPSGPDHPFDKHRLAEGLIRTAMPPSKAYIDCCGKTKEEIADAIDVALRDRKAEVDGQTAVAATQKRLQDAQTAAKAASRQRLEAKMQKAGERRERAEAALQAKLDELATMKSAGK